MWVKLNKHIGEGSIWFSLPTDSMELRFEDGDLISYLIENDKAEQHQIGFRLVPWLRTINGIHCNMKLRCPFINAPHSLIELDQVLVNAEELKNI